MHAANSSDVVDVMTSEGDSFGVDGTIVGACDVASSFGGSKVTVAQMRKPDWSVLSA